MIRKLFSKIKYPVGIIVWIASSYWFISDSSEGDTYRIPIILSWIPDVFGWNAFFIFISLGLGFAAVGICSLIAKDADDVFK